MKYLNAYEKSNKIIVSFKRPACSIPISGLEANSARHMEVYMLLEGGSAVIDMAHVKATVTGSGTTTTDGGRGIT